MVTGKDLAEAHAFNRRRLVAAFVSGAPGGRGVEPARPGRALLAGVAVAVLLVAAAVVLGVVRSPSAVDWTREGLVSDRDTGADYLVLRTAADGDETEVRPLVNITSAMLVLGADVRPTEVAGEALDDRPRGPPVGILGAPTTPPPASALVPTGWTACTGGTRPSGIAVHLADPSPVTPTPDLVLLVRTFSGDLHLVARPADGGPRDDEGAHAYPVPRTARTDHVLDAVAGTDEARAVVVPDDWVALLPAGGALELERFGIDDALLDAPWPLREGLGEDDARAGAEVGDLLEVDGRSYLLTPDGVRALSGFAASLYEQLAFPGADDPATFEVARLPEADVRTGPLPGTSWPRSVRDAAGPSHQPCALLDTSGERPAVRLGTTGADAAASAAGVPPAEVERTVEAGHGAFVRPGDWSGARDDDAGPVLVDDAGLAHRVGAGEEAERLGYGDVAEVVVPAAWVALFEPGSTLSIEAAHCPPSLEPDAGCG